MVRCYRASMAAPPGSPLDGTSRIVIDGTNLLFRLGGGRNAAPQAAVVGRLRAAIPATVAIDLVFDGVGHGVSGRLAQEMYVRWSGRRTADHVILELADEAAIAAGDGTAAASAVLVVTDDRELRYRLQVRGVKTVPLTWLTNRFDRPALASPAVANRRPTLGAGTVAGQPNPDDAPDRPRWSPGRGATTKTGPTHKIARHKRHPNNG